MRAPHGDDFAFDPQLLAAYLDGELDDGPDQADLRRRVQQWLAHCPEAADEARAFRQMRDLMDRTTPADPSEADWDQSLARVRRRRAAAVSLAGATRPWQFSALVAAVLTAAAAVWVALALWPRDPAPDAPPAPRVEPRAEVKKPAPPVKPLPVAREDEIEILPFAVVTADEVEILRMGGADTRTVVVAVPPVTGLLAVVEPGDVEVTRAEPEVRMGDGPPTMLWVRPPGVTDE